MELRAALPFLFLGLLAWGGQAQAAPGQNQENPRKEVTARGRVVCLDAGESPLGIGRDCDPAASGFDHFGLTTYQGKVHSFLARDARAEMFTDPRVRARELEVTGWLTAEGRLEITKIFSVVEGKLHDLYYFCSVCNIKSHTPGPCWCCRADFELKEDPH